VPRVTEEPGSSEGQNFRSCCGRCTATAPEHLLCWEGQGCDERPRHTAQAEAALEELSCLVQMLLVNFSSPALLAPSPLLLSQFLLSLFCSNSALISPSFPFSIPVSLASRFPFSPYENCFPLFCSSFRIPVSFLLFAPLCHPLPLAAPNSRDQQSLLSPHWLSATRYPAASPSHSSCSSPIPALKPQLFVQPLLGSSLGLRSFLTVSSSVCCFPVSQAPLSSGLHPNGMAHEQRSCRPVVCRTRTFTVAPALQIQHLLTAKCPMSLPNMGHLGLSQRLVLTASRCFFKRKQKMLFLIKRLPLAKLHGPAPASNFQT